MMNGNHKPDEFDVAICFSGGVDSIVATRICQLAGLRCAALHINMHGPSSPAELKAARDFCRHWQVPLEIVDYRCSKSIPFANRIDEFFGPLTLLTLCSCFAASIGARSIALGLTAEQVTELVADRRWLAADAILPEIRFPLQDLSKVEVLKMAPRVGISLEQTWSCKTASDVPCGRCEACRDRLLEEE